MLFKLIHNITGGHVAGEIKSTAQLAGCDINHLVNCGAIEPVGSGRRTLLLSDDPTKEELVAEIDRLQHSLEDAEIANDTLRAQLGNPRLRPSPQSGPAPEAELMRLRADLADAKRTADAASATIRDLASQRDAAHERADKYVGRLAELEPHPTTHGSPNPAATGIAQTPAPADPAPVKPSNIPPPVAIPADGRADSGVIRTANKRPTV